MLRYSRKCYKSGSPKYVTLFRVSILRDSIFGVLQNCNSIFGGQQKIADLDPQYRKVVSTPWGASIRNFHLSPRFNAFLA